MPDRFLRRQAGFPRRLQITVALALVGMIVGAIWLSRQYDTRIGWVRHTLEVQNELSLLVITLQEAETGQRGFLLTGEPAYLAPYERARDLVRDEIARLTALTRDNAEQQRALGQIDETARAKLDELRQTVELRQAGDAEGALALVRTDRGLVLMERLREQIGAMAATEARLLEERSRDAVTYSWALLAAIAASGLLIVALMAAWVRGARRAASALAEANATIVKANEGLERTVEERTRALRGSTEHLGLILDSAVDYAFITMDVSGRITSWSPGAQRIFGWTQEEAVGQPSHLIFTEEDRRNGVPEREIGQALAHGHAIDERWHRRKDGSRFFASGELTPMETADRGIALLKIARDRTAARRQEDELRRVTATLEQRVDERTRELSESNRALVAEMKNRESAEAQVRQLQKMEAVGQLTGGIAHDFNNMLAIVIGSLNLVQRRLAKGNTDIGKYIEGAIEGATRAATLTSRLLAFSRQQALAPEPVDANRLVSGMSELLRRTIGEEIRLETVLAGGLWRSHADPGQLENAVLNLAVNARDAMPDGGRLTIETGNCHLDEAYAAEHAGIAPGQYVMLAVTDTGAGMAPEVIGKAFEPFFTTKDVGRGTGLGLYQVYGFVRQSGGHVKIYSEPGQGTTVKLYIPRFIGAEDRPATPLPAPKPVPAGNPREIILVVEDEERVRHFAVEALRELGYTTLHADGAAPALRVLDGHPDVTMLLTDIVMPDVNGRKLAEEALKRRPNLKVIYMTGFTRNAVVHNGVLDPGVNFLQKPFTLDQLASKVRGVLGAPPG